MPGQTTGERRDSEQARRLSDTKGEPGSKKAAEQATVPPGRTWLWFLGLLFLNYFMVRLLLPGPEEPTTVPYTLFKNEVGKGNVGAIYSEGATITGRFITPVAYPLVDEKGQKPSGERNGTASPAPATQAPPTMSGRRFLLRKKALAEL